MNSKRFARKLKELRERADDSQEKLGEILDVGVKQIQRYERGDLLPDHDKVQILCERYQYDFVSLIYDVPRDTFVHEAPTAYYTLSKTDPSETIAKLVDQNLSLTRMLESKLISSDAGGKASGHGDRGGKGKRPDIADAGLSGNKTPSSDQE